MPEIKNYSGCCHCGQVYFDVSTPLEPVISCNCSICTKRGALWTFVKPEQFALHSGEDALVEYQFNKKVIRHLFCDTCGVEAFARGTAPDGSEMIAVNVRCLEGVEVATLTPTPFNGRAL